jgi:anti-sigma B factor antagonist
MTISEFHSTFLALEDHADVVVARITRPQLSEEENIDVFGKDLNDLVEQFGCRRMIVSLEDVRYITSAALGKLITLNRRLHRKDGRLVICGAPAPVQEILAASRLHEYFTLADDVAAALSVIADDR